MAFTEFVEELGRQIPLQIFATDLSLASIDKARMSVPIYAGGAQAGYATSGGWSPLLKKYVALAHLRARCAAAGTPLEMEVTVEHERRRAAARVVKKPFFDPERKRA